MDPELVAAEERMKALENKILNLEISSVNAQGGNHKADAVEAAVKAYQKQILDRLKDARQAFIAEGADIVTLRRERDAALEENKTLKKENERMMYRIRHLIKALNEEEKRNT